MSVLFVVFGSILSIEYIANITFINELPTSYKETTNSYEITINEETDIDYSYQLEIDENLDNDVLKFEVSYNDDFYNNVKPVLSENDIYFEHDFKITKFKLNNKYFKMIIEDLKTNTIYNYGKLSDIEVKVYCNSYTAQFID